MIIPAISSQNPYLIIWDKGISPDPKIMALGGVATGRRKAKLQAIAEAMTGGKGFMPEVFEMAMTMGMIMLAEAVLEVTSVKKTLRIMVTKVIRERLIDFPEGIKKWPMASAKPVWKIWVPRDNPPRKARVFPSQFEGPVSGKG